MEKIEFREIELELIMPSPMNPRKGSYGEAYKGLVDSIEKKGVIEPIIVRPAPLRKAATGKVKDALVEYEIVAGERRYKASLAAGLKTIPAVVRELDDDEAYDFMLIENLQREDLTALEEAESFKTYAARHGKYAITELAQKTGIDPRYIRTRIEVLRLPKPALAAWEKGEVSFGHLEQFLRLPGPTEVVKKLAEVKRDQMSVAWLRHEIGEWSLPLSKARFDFGKECARCRQNSVVQQDLFGIGDAKGMCMNPKCFKGKQAAWLNAHWAETPVAKKYRTKGARFDADFGFGGGGDRKSFYGQKGFTEKCLSCDNFVSLVGEYGGVENSYTDGTACVGDERCFKATEKAAKRVAGAKTKDEKKAAVAAAGRGPIPWHGAYFRNLFFRKRIPEVLASLKPDDEKTKKLLAMCLARESMPAGEALMKGLGFKSNSVGERTLFEVLLLAPYNMVAPILGKMVEAVINEGADRYGYCAFDTSNRQLAAVFLGIDVKKEWAADEEYMRLKTRRELLAFGKMSGILKDGKAKAYILNVLKKKRPTTEGLKKSELVDVFMNSGVELVGKVPAEILK